MTQLTIEDLTQIASDFLRDEYGLALEIPIKRNNRLKRAMGRYIESPNENDELIPNRIEISGEMFVYGAEIAIIKTLKHELVHYALAIKGEPNDDGQPHFEAELRRVGASATKSVALGEVAMYRCDSCGTKDFSASPSVIKRISQTTKGWSTRCCDASLTYVDIVICDGTKSVNELFTEVNAK